MAVGLAALVRLVPHRPRTNRGQMIKGRFSIIRKPALVSAASEYSSKAAI